MTLIAVTALNGRAAVAESRGEGDTAKRLYREAADRARTTYPKLAEQAERRAESVDNAVMSITLAEADPAAPPAGDKLPVSIDPALRGLLLPDDFGPEPMALPPGLNLPPNFQMPPGGLPGMQ